MRSSVEPEDFFKLRNDEERIKFLLNFAILAPSSYNSQPWLFRVRGLTLELWGDEKRALTQSDQNHRQLFLSLGAALENLLIAADYYGWPVKVELFPEPRERFFAARLTMSSPNYRAEEANRASLIFSAIPLRHTSRYPYEDKPVPQEFLAAIEKLEAQHLEIFFITDAEKKEKAIDIVGRATQAAFADQGFKNEFSRWIKPNLKKYSDGMPGYNIGISWLFSFIVPFMIRHLDVGKACLLYTSPSPRD